MRLARIFFFNIYIYEYSFSRVFEKKMFITIFNCSGSNSLRMVVTCLSDFCVCNSWLPPSCVMIDLTLRPSGVSSSNSSFSLNVMDVFLNVELDDNEYLPSSVLVSSTTGDTELPTLRVNMPTPGRKNKKKKKR